MPYSMSTQSTQRGRKLRQVLYLVFLPEPCPSSRDGKQMLPLAFPMDHIANASRADEEIKLHLVDIN